jgi:glycosyltransferase involved in cell wall biosynthesis
MKIAIISSVLDHCGGAQRTAIMEARLLKEMGHDVTLYGKRVDKSKCYPELIKDLNVKAYYVVSRLPVLKTTWKLIKLVHLPMGIEGADIVITHNTPQSFVGLYMKRKFKSKFLFYCHGLWKKIHGQESVPALIKLLISFYDRKAASEADAVFVNCKKMYGKIENVYHIKPGILPYGIDYFPPSNSEKIRERFGNPKYMILNISRIHPLKGIEESILGFKRAGLLDAKLIIIGSINDRNYYEKLLKLIDTYHLEDSVFFVGEYSGIELANFYSGSDFILYTPFDEDFGLVPLEALQYGKPSIVSIDAGLIDEFKDSCLSVNQHDEEQLAGAICQLAEKKSLRDKLVENGKKRLTQFSWEKHINSLCEYFN